LLTRIDQKEYGTITGSQIAAVYSNTDDKNRLDQKFNGAVEQI